MSNPNKNQAFQMIADVEGDFHDIIKGKTPDNLPILPVRNLVLFPGVVSPILIGRDSSKMVVQKAEKRGDLIGVVCQRDPDVDVPMQEDLYETGVFAKVVKLLSLPNGNITAIVQCQGRLRLKQLTQTIPYLEGDVEPLEDIDPEKRDREFKTAMEDLRNIVNEYINVSEDIPDEATFAIKNISNDIMALNFVCSNMPFTTKEKMKLLEMDSVKERLFNVMKIINREINLQNLKADIRNKTREDIDEQQRNYFLQQQIKNMQAEMGNDSSPEKYELIQKAEKKHWPAEINKTFFKEVEKLDNLNPQSPEFNVQLNYLQTLVSLPWEEYTKDDLDLKRAQKILDEDHYGMEKVKERILEHMAVLALRGDLKSPIICLYGPPGVGKTSLGKSIASAMKRKYVRMSLGGLHDEAEIRGHRRTYIGAMPGRIIKSIQKAGSSNPVFILDEIDKVTQNTHNGDPASALLEVLDPEQNSMFSDNYLEEPYDLSKVLFVATANDLYSIPDALRDRLEIIEMSSYTEEEKLHIATDHLIRKELEANGLKASMFKLDREEILYIIRHYTREAGVRQLERMIGKLCRKTALAITKGEKKNVKVSKKLIQQWLGKEIYEYGQKEDEDQVGVATGLAYTQFGGDILPIEVTYFDGKGGLIITGQLGDVMKESATIAVGYVKSNARKYGIDPKFFEENDIHIHVPEGAVPKDGPSAGITLTTAVISAITGRKVSSKLAMTGEVTLRGNVLPIGGLREKTMAAFRSDIHTIILPKNNLKDLDDVPQSVRETMKFIPVKSMDEVLKIALITH